MFTDREYFQVIKEIYDISTLKAKKQLLFCNEAKKASTLDHIVTKLYKHIQDKITEIDFGSIPKSKGDITKIEGKDIPDFDMLLAGFPCFSGDMLVYTVDGYKKISDIQIGMKVLTHKGRFCEVKEVMEKVVDDFYNLFHSFCIPRKPICPCTLLINLGHPALMWGPSSLQSLLEIGLRFLFSDLIEIDSLS